MDAVDGGDLNCSEEMWLDQGALSRCWMVKG